jgi:emfourin
MRQRTLVIAGLAAVGVAIAVAVPMAILALQGSHELKFEYAKAGGIAGVNEKLVFDSKASFDSKTNIIVFYKGTSGATQKQLSDAQVQAIREAIAGSGFFAMDGIPPKTGQADYFSYSLTVTTEDMTHSVSWVDDFASSEPVPEELKNIVNKIEDAYATAS